MHRKNMRRGMMVALAIIAGIFLLRPGLTFAGVGGSDTPTVTSPVAVGQTYTWEFTIQNTSTNPNRGDEVEILPNNNIFFTTTCGSSLTPSLPCQPEFQEAPNTITIISNGTGQAGSSCAGVSFTVAATANPNEYVFTPTTTPVLLGPSNGSGPKVPFCTVEFQVRANLLPVHDSSASAGLQTSQLARVETLQDTATDETGSAAGTSTVSVMQIVTAPNPTQGLVGDTLNDSATLSGGNNPTGTITFKLFGPGNDNCSGSPICTKAVPVTGNKTYDSTPSGCTANAGPGTYHWIASYSGDANNPPVSSNCADEAVVIKKCTPEFFTTPSPENGCAGAVLNDSATLSGNCTPTGTITFKLFGPDDNNCSTAICTKTVSNVNGNGSYPTPSGCTVTQDGTYQWTAFYSGDGNTDSADSACGLEPVDIITKPVTIVTAANPTSGCPGAVLNDRATLSGGCEPPLIGGTITFKLFGPNNDTCSGDPTFTTTVNVNGTGTYDTPNGFTTVEKGTYHWIACYSGNGACTPCGDPKETVEIDECPQGGESPYIGIVGNDILFNPFYFSEKHQQFLFDQGAMDVPVCWGTNPPASYQTRVPVPPAQIAGCEQFRSNKPINQPEICDKGGVVNDYWEGDFEFRGESNALITKQSAGYFEWWIRLPKRPNGEINICIQCGILKPNTFTPYGFGAVELCAAETGERVGRGICTRNQVAAGVNPIVESALPKITAWAYPGPYANESWKGFRLTAYKNPGTYNLSTEEDDAVTNPMRNSPALQVLNGSANARVLLKSCMDKCVIAKIPVTGQVNALGDTEHDLEAGDLIKVRLDIPNNNTVDIYCHSQSTKIMGIGVPE